MLICKMFCAGQERMVYSKGIGKELMAEALKLARASKQSKPEKTLQEIANDVSAQVRVSYKSLLQRLEKKLADTAGVGPTPILNTGVNPDLEDDFAKFLLECADQGLAYGRDGILVMAKRNNSCPVNL